MGSQKYILFFCGYFLLTCAAAQNPKIDSLRAQLEIAQSDTVRVNTLNQLSYLIYSSSPDEAISYGNEAQELSEKLSFKRGRAYALKNIGLHPADCFGTAPLIENDPDILSFLSA